MSVARRLGWTALLAGSVAFGGAAWADGGAAQIIGGTTTKVDQYP